MRHFYIKLHHLTDSRSLILLYNITGEFIACLDAADERWDTDARNDLWPNATMLVCLTPTAEQFEHFWETAHSNKTMTMTTINELLAEQTVLNAYR